jgi:hypothetical protein
MEVHLRLFFGGLDRFLGSKFPRGFLERILRGFMRPWLGLLGAPRLVG